MSPLFSTTQVLPNLRPLTVKLMEFHSSMSRLEYRPREDLR
ncbi:hypothetical protein SLEP1_g55956 [Rubroshorea leprosula]|uniref:Uncharacterized protein n=1 Tax=Rubroshorea leprosula TaxID=152421 RepID=A0AAV5MGZ6_9ROSI|nr:hypothetical protein SLEP1_g55956 [Rubroshorea leprosula]